MSILLTARSCALHALYARIERALGAVPAGMRIDGDSLNVPAPHDGGYEISARAVDGGIHVDFGGLIAEFADVAPAAAWIARAASGAYRLRIEYRGARPVEWVLERRDGAAAWPSLASGNVLLLPWPRRKRTRYLSNAA